MNAQNGEGLAKCSKNPNFTMSAMSLLEDT